MLARDFVVRKAKQSIVLVPPPDSSAKYAVSNDYLYILYHAQIPWKGDYQSSDNIFDQPIVVGFRADEFLVGESNHNTETRFMQWAAGRAREILNEKILNQKWQIELSPAHMTDLFRVTLIGDSDEKLRQKVFQTNSFPWTYFFQPDSDEYSEVENRYREDARY